MAHTYSLFLDWWRQEDEFIHSYEFEASLGFVASQKPVQTTSVPASNKH